MRALSKRHTAGFQDRLRRAEIDLAVISDQDSIAYLAGLWGYLGPEFGRPTLLLVPSAGAPIIITPLMELEMARAMTWIEDLRPWQDDGPDRWEAVLARTLDESRPASLGWDEFQAPPMVAAALAKASRSSARLDVSPILAEMRMIKSAEEIEIMRQGGQIAVAMVEAAKAVMAEGVPEYEIALAALQGGTRRAAGFLSGAGWDAFVSPLIHDLQIMQSGPHTAMVHRRASTRQLEAGDPVYMCFCNMAKFKQYKLGFDRQFFIGSCSEEQARLYETTIEAQAAALAAIRPGAAAEDAHFAAEAVYRAAGFSAGYRTGRAIGISYLEAPELKAGDKTALQPGMTFAVDGGITVPGSFGTRVGDSIVVTETGHEVLTPYPKTLSVIGAG